MGVLILPRKRQKKEKPKKLLNRVNMFNINLKPETRLDTLTLLLLNNSKLVDCQLVFLPDLDNADDVTVTFLKVLNWNSTTRRFTRENTDKHFCFLIFTVFSFCYGRSENKIL